MKRLLAVCLVLALLCGCNADRAQTEAATEDTTEAPTETVAHVRQDDGIFGLSYLPEYGLNPFTSTATVNRALFSLLYESLFVVSNRFRAEPLLCESFRASEDSMTYSFTLISDACFSDGTKMTAEDVVRSIQAAQGSALYSARLSHIREVRSEADGTVTVRLDTPYENFCLMLDVPIVKASTIEGFCPVGSGPYVKQGQTLVPNPHRRQDAAPVVDEQTIPLNSADTSRGLRDQFEFGTTDLTYCDPNAPSAVGYRCDYEAWEAPTTIMHYIGFNLGSGYFADDTLRAAVTYAVDRGSLVTEVYGGFAQAGVLPCSPLSDLYDAQLAEEYDYAPSAFTAAVHNSGVLTEPSYADYVGYFLVCSEDPTRVAAAEAIAEALRAAGLNIVVSAKGWSDYKAALKNGDFDLYYGEVRLTTNFDLSPFFDEDGALSYGSVASADLARLCTEALANSGDYVKLCSQILSGGRLCPVVFKSYAVYATRGVISTLTPGVDYLFRNAAAARSLSDADKTYE